MAEPDCVALVTSIDEGLSNAESVGAEVVVLVDGLDKLLVNPKVEVSLPRDLAVEFRRLFRVDRGVLWVRNVWSHVCHHLAKGEQLGGHQSHQNAFAVSFYHYL